MLILQRVLWLFALPLGALAVLLGPCRGEEVQLLPLVVSHYDQFLLRGLDTYGPYTTANWMASLDTNTKSYPVNDFANAGRRIYRQNPSPKGANLYWDIPQIDAAVRLSAVTGDSKYSDSARDYIAAYLNPVRSDDSIYLADSGLWKWGEHWYYRAFDDPADEVNNYFNDRTIGFSGSHHEMRPLTPDWQLFWDMNPSMTATQIDRMGRYHVEGGYETTTGRFSRHDHWTTPTSQDSHHHAFVDAGGVLVESLAWLAQKSTGPDRDKYLSQAKIIAEFSHSARLPATGLIRNNHSTDRFRWDYNVTTSEIGVWAGKLLVAADYTGDLEYLEMARDGVLPWLQYAWHPAAGRYYGKVNVSDGTPNFDESTEYQPLDYSSPWNVLVPSHDHFLGMAEALIELYQWGATYHPQDLPILETHIERMAKNIVEERPALNARDGMGAYAEPYGQSVHFLLAASQVLNEPTYRKHAERLAHEAVTVLYTGDMFRTHGKEDRYDAVDGFGFLAEALLDLGSYNAPDEPGIVARYPFAAGVSWTASNDAASDSAASNINAGSGISISLSAAGQPTNSIAVPFASASTTSQDAAIAANDFLSFSITPEDGMVMNLSHLVFDLSRSSGSTETSRYFVRSSADGYTENLAADDLSGDRFETYFISLIGEEFQRVANGIEFRFYFYDLGGASSGTALLDNIELYAESVEGIAGDYNGDGWVNLADYAVWRDHLGQVGDAAADGNRDRVVDLDDYTLWKQQMLKATGAAAAAQAVPEPAGWVICGMVLATLCAVKKV